MHAAAVKSLQKINLRISFERQWFERAKGNEESGVWNASSRRKNQKLE